MNIEKLKEDATWIKKQLSKNIININDINAFLDNILNDEDNKTASEVSSKSEVLSTNDIITLFKSFLKTKCDTRGNLIKTWSVHETLSSQELEDILKYANDVDSKYFVDAATDYIMDDYVNISESVSNKLIDEFYNTIGLRKKIHTRNHILMNHY